MKPFNVRAVSWKRPDRVFRVYASDQDIIFIRLAGQSVNWVAALVQLGPLGFWLGRKLNDRRDRILRSRADEADRVPPQVRVHEHSYNFRIGPGDITTTDFEPGRQISVHGAYAARWKLALRDGRKWNFVFEDAGEANRAFQVLVTALGERLVADVAWDESKAQFRRRQASSQEAA